MKGKYWITIDGGTTNTRIVLWDEQGRMTASCKSEVGVRITAIEGSPASLKKAVKEGIEQVCREAGITWEDVERIAASGMITSNMGLVEIPHIPAPAGIRELRAAAKTVLLPEVCPLPITFVPGVKNSIGRIDLTNFEQMDMMRGEEVETIGMLQHLEAGRPYLLILPGSHTKFVSVDGEGRITGCLTTITGELLQVITCNTLIADAVDKQFVSEDTYDREMLLAGYRAAARAGIGRACFSARILNTFAEKDKRRLANYLLGAVFQNDLTAVKGSSAIQIDPGTVAVVAGKNPLRQALCDLLSEEKLFPFVQNFTHNPGTPLASEGILLIVDGKK